MKKRMWVYWSVISRNRSFPWKKKGFSTTDLSMNLKYDAQSIPSYLVNYYLFSYWNDCWATFRILFHLRTRNLQTCKTSGRSTAVVPAGKRIWRHNAVYRDTHRVCVTHACSRWEWITPYKKCYAMHMTRASREFQAAHRVMWLAMALWKTCTSLVTNQPHSTQLPQLYPW